MVCLMGWYRGRPEAARYLCKSCEFEQQCFSAQDGLEIVMKGKLDPKKKLIYWIGRMKVEGISLKHVAADLADLIEDKLQKGAITALFAVREKLKRSFSWDDSTVRRVAEEIMSIS